MCINATLGDDGWLTATIRAKEPELPPPATNVMRLGGSTYEYPPQPTNLLLRCEIQRMFAPPLPALGAAERERVEQRAAELLAEAKPEDNLIGVVLEDFLLACRANRHFRQKGHVTALSAGRDGVSCLWLIVGNTPQEVKEEGIYLPHGHRMILQPNFPDTDGCRG